jgi:hypothetical protein
LIWIAGCQAHSPVLNIQMQCRLPLFIRRIHIDASCFHPHLNHLERLAIASKMQSSVSALSPWCHTCGPSIGQSVCCQSSTNQACSSSLGDCFNVGTSCFHQILNNVEETIVASLTESTFGVRADSLFHIGTRDCALGHAVRLLVTMGWTSLPQIALD